MVIVNGYICMNCCDIDKARLGQDPQQSTDQLQKQLKRHVDRLDPANFGPAVTFGGSLQATTAADSANALNGQPSSSQNVNRPIPQSGISLIV